MKWSPQYRLYSTCVCYIPTTYLFLLTVGPYLLISFASVICTPHLHPLWQLPVGSLYVWVYFCYVLFVLFFTFHVQVKSYVFTFLWHFLLGMIPSSSINIAANSKTSLFLWLSNISCVYDYIYSHTHVVSSLGFFPCGLMDSFSITGLSRWR